MENKQVLEYGTVIMKLGSRVAATAVTNVSRGKRGIVREPAIVAQKLTETERDGLGLLEVGDYGLSGHKVYVIA
jgi:hypothetical protein